MHQPPQTQPDPIPTADEPDVGFLAEVLTDRELPLGVDVRPTVIDLTATGQIVIDLTERAREDRDPSTVDGDGGGWGLDDDTSVGRIVTPDHVLAARSGFRRIAAGRPLAGSAGKLYLTTAGFATEYVTRNLRDVEWEPAGPHTSSVEGRALARVEVLNEARHRLEYFLELDDDDFSACFRFNGDITGEYLQQVERCERARAAARADDEPAEAPTAGQRRRRKARSLRDL